MENLKLGINGYKRIIISDHPDGEMFPKAVKDVTPEFYRCVIWGIGEVKEFEIDGMRFRATCERIE